MKKKDSFCCGMKLRRKPFKQPPQYYCNSCGKNFIKYKGELIEGKQLNFVRYANKLYIEPFGNTVIVNDIVRNDTL